MCENERLPLNKGGLQGGCVGLVAATVSRGCRVLNRVRHSQIFLLALIFASTTGQIWRDKVSRKNAEGNALYEQKNFPGALDKYVEANDGKSHRQELAYNLANAFYQQKKYQEALQELMAHTFVSSLLKTHSAAARHLAQCARLLRTVSVARIGTRGQLDSLSSIVRMVEQDIAGTRGW